MQAIADLAAGRQALDREDYATALKEFLPLLNTAERALRAHVYSSEPRRSCARSLNLQMIQPREEGEAKLSSLPENPN
jgi:hypothetical protein